MSAFIRRIIFAWTMFAGRLVRAMTPVGRAATCAVASGAALSYSSQTAEAEAGSNGMVYAAIAALGYTAYANAAKMEANDARLQALEFEAAQKTMSAFVFVKPHAVTKAVLGCVEQKLGEAGISVLGEGSISGPEIDSKMYIDTHYGAIAAKAVKMKPTELAPSAKAQKAFHKAFGLTWAEALKQGKVYNAADGCKKLGITGDELDAKWSTLKRDTNLIKFGGGFYCGQVEGIFIINGFYMSMRGKFTAPDANIHYYLVSWPAHKLSWADFRGKVLGATDPTLAEKGSLRRIVYDEWQGLGLAAEPDTGDNGLHASASPFEALAERLNWCGGTVETDQFGKGMLAAGVDKQTILKWADDPQVTVGPKTKASLFDSLEDLDADQCLAKAKAIADLNK